MPRSIEEIRAELRAAEIDVEREAKAQREATLIKKQYTIQLATGARAIHQKIYDPNCRLYLLSGTVVNLEEAKVAGHPDYRLKSGSMTYVFNLLSQRIIMSTGGGEIFIGDSFGSVKDDSDDIAFEEINAFLIFHPEGGDITDIVERHQTRRGRA